MYRCFAPAAYPLLTRQHSLTAERLAPQPNLLICLRELERATRIERATLTLARLASEPPPLAAYLQYV